jgi:hypothetical protein
MVHYGPGLCAIPKTDLAEPLLNIRCRAPANSGWMHFPHFAKIPPSAACHSAPRSPP